MMNGLCPPFNAVTLKKHKDEVMFMDVKPVTRFAPSPTGYLHVGGARTALYNWLYARKNGGKFLLRIEDTDTVRSTNESTDSILRSLEWLGIDWDGGPYYQSERLALYKEKIEDLAKNGYIYPAFETKEELEAMRQKAMNEKRNPIYDRAALKLSKDEVESRINKGDSFVWRFRVPDEGRTIVPELLMGGEETSLRNSDIGDFVITRPGTIREPGMPLYNFVCAIDDADMGISHIIRGVEHLSNAVRQVLLYQAFGSLPPSFVHLPIIMKNGKKMSKRDPDAGGKFPVSVLDRKKIGYLPEATLNHLALLGWSHPDASEFLTIEEMVKTFTLERLNKANPHFDEQKYLHFNSMHLSRKPDRQLLNLVLPYLKAAGFSVSDFTEIALEKMVGLEKKRCQVLSEFPGALAYFFLEPREYEEKGVKKDFLQQGVDVCSILTATQEAVMNTLVLDKKGIDTSLDQMVVSAQGAPYKIAGPIVRLALTGRTQSPSLSEIIEILGVEQTVRRLENAKVFIKSQTSVPTNTGGLEASSCWLKGVAHRLP